MQFPHCDARVLHAPADGCVYCNKHADWQELRKVWGINFTGHHDTDKLTCPSEIARPISTINRWHGNVPMTEELIEEEKKYWEELRKELEKGLSES